VVNIEFLYYIVFDTIDSMHPDAQIKPPSIKSAKLIIAAFIVLNSLLFIILFLSHHYSPIVILLHIISLILLWGFVLYHLRVVTYLRTKWKELVLIIFLIIIALFTRLYRVEEITPGMYGDELTVAMTSLHLLKETEWPPFINNGYYHPTPLLYITARSVQTFGHTITAIRLPSIVFGALSVAAFYILLRLFFPLPIATAGAMLMIFQYTHVVLSRLAYEPIPSLFFQILVLIFFVLYHRTKKLWSLIGLALSLGAGMYTYLNFRPFAVLLFTLTLFPIFQKNWRQHLQHAVIFIAIVFLAIMPLINSFITDSKGFWGRSSEISIFSQHYSPTEFSKELWGNIYRTAILPFYGNTPSSPDSPLFSGDPNPGKNPSGVPMFDPLTVAFAAIGFVYLFIKKRFLFWIILLLLLPPLVSDIFSIEVIPEGHYYGLGHPNALRTSGFIVGILFAAVAGAWCLYCRWGKQKLAESLTVLAIVILIISYWNWQLYFNQAEINPFSFIYNYNWNHGQPLQMVTYLNQTSAKKISMTKDLADEAMVTFFLDPTKQISRFQLVATSSALTVVKNNDITAVNVTDDTIPILNGMESVTNMGYSIQILKNPVGKPKTVIFEKNSLNKTSQYLPNSFSTH